MKSRLLTVSVLLAAIWPAVPAMATPAGAITLFSAAELPVQCDATLSRTGKQIAALEKLPLPKVTLQNTLQAWNRLDIEVQNLAGPVGLLSEVSPDAAVRKAAEACELKLMALFNKTGQSRALYQRFKALKASDEIDVEARRQTLEEFERAGVNLPKARREQVRKLQDSLTRLSQDFARNLRDNKTKLSFTPDELAGVPKEFLAKARRDDAGNYLIGFDAPESEAIMGFADSEAVRQRYQYEFSRRGGEANLAILREVMHKRQQLAQLMAYPDYATFVLKQRMAASPDNVNRFLAEVQSQVEALEKRELAELGAEKAKHLNLPQAGLKRWDFLYYEQKLRKARYSIDAQAVRAQFPSEPTVKWMLKVSSDLYDLEFRANPDLPKWHDDVRGYDVFDRANGTYLSSFYLDLFPRDGKYKHAAAFPVRAVSTLEKRTPVSVLVTNFSRDGFNQDELETLFHEFGHVLHGVLSQTRYALNAGTAVKRDFVEAPSQMYEEWPRRPEAQKLFNEVCPTCKPIDPQLMERLNQARQFGQGIRYARQRLFAAYDMALFSGKAVDPMVVWSEMEGNTPLGHVPGTQFPGSFGHIVGGYAAGYYGYMWSEVLALDMLSAFGDNVMNPSIGARYRQLILENGGQRDPNQLVESFLGRKPSPDAFFREITGQRSPVSAAASKAGSGS